jgi:PPOX class probable F420-dependent enzyme
VKVSPLRRFSDVQTDFLKSHDVCRLATVSSEGMPQVTPVIYALDGENFIVAVDYGTKKLANLRENPKTSLVVDEYGKKNRAVMIQGNCTIFEKGQEYLRLLKILFKRYEVYRLNPWNEGESPILSITPENIVAWGVE